MRHEFNGHDRVLADYYDVTYNSHLDEQQLLAPGYFTWGFWDHDTRDQTEAVRVQMQSIIDRAMIGAQDRVLDVGCGLGASSLDIQRWSGCKSVTGIDI